MGFSRQEDWSGCHFLLQGVFPARGSSPGLPHCRQTLYCPSHQGSQESKVRICISNGVLSGGFLVAHRVKSPPAMRRLQFRSRAGQTGPPLQYSWASVLGRMVKSPPAMWATGVCSLDWEAPLEEGRAPHPALLPGESPQTEEPGGLQSMGPPRARHCEETD